MKDGHELDSGGKAIPKHLQVGSAQHGVERTGNAGGELGHRSRSGRGSASGSGYLEPDLCFKPTHLRGPVRKPKAESDGAARALAVPPSSPRPVFEENGSRYRTRPGPRDQPRVPDFRSAHDSFGQDTNRVSPHPSQRVDGKMYALRVESSPRIPSK